MEKKTSIDFRRDAAPRAPTVYRLELPLESQRRLTPPPASTAAPPAKSTHQRHRLLRAR